MKNYVIFVFILIISVLFIGGLEILDLKTPETVLEDKKNRELFDCKIDTRYLFTDLSDTWGNNTNNEDSISKTMAEFYYKCSEKVEKKYEIILKELNGQDN